MWTVVPGPPLESSARVVPAEHGYCPCGEKGDPSQTWSIEWYDRIGLVEQCVVIRLCGLHRARRPGED